MWICVLCEAVLVAKYSIFVDLVTKMKSKYLPVGLCTSEERHLLYVEANPLDHALCFLAMEFSQLF